LIRPRLSLSVAQSARTLLTNGLKESGWNAHA
jgi:hypothetical protein